MIKAALLPIVRIRAEHLAPLTDHAQIDKDGIKDDERVVNRAFIY
ncbi:hypothetical protein [Undibacterium flavidum]|nr:hypothetical protein [Undibacterium flavidum]